MAGTVSGPRGDDTPTRTFTIPVTEAGSYIFAVSGVEVVLATLRVGKTVISYAVPGADLGDGRIALDFLGAPFHAALVQTHSKVEIDIEYYGDDFPNLHMGSNDFTDKKWSPGMGDHVDNVCVRNKAGTLFDAQIVYTRGTCGLRNMKMRT